MTDQPNRPNPSWKSAAGGRDSGGGPPQRPWQQDATLPAEGKRKFPRWLKLGLVAGGFGVVVGVIIVVILLLAPTPPPLVVLVSAGNEKAIGVPQAAAGRKGLDELKEVFVATSDSGGPAESITLHPAELTTDPADRDKLWSSLQQSLLQKASWKKQEKVIFFVAGPGGADGKGAYVVPQGADAVERSSVVRVKDLLEPLRNLPDATYKLVIFDVTQTASSWPWGMFQNDFARGLEGMEAEIRSIPNLLVLCASRPGERSWVWEERGKTVFTHFVTEGLRGAAEVPAPDQGNGIVTAGDLYAYVKREVASWVRTNRNATQTPLLLGGENASAQEKLAAAMRLRNVRVGPKYTPAEDPPGFTPSGELSGVWKQCEGLAAERPALFAAPLWRLFLDTALRQEELERVGSPRAEEVRKDLDTLAERLRDARALSLESRSNSIALSEALGLGLTPRDEQQLKSAFNPLWEQKDTPPDRFEELTRSDPRELRQLQLTGLLLDKAIADPTPAALSRPAQCLPRFNGPRPVEAEHLPSLPRLLAKNAAPERVGKLLAVRLLAERAALGLGPAEGLPVASEQVRPWIEKTVTAADTSRRLGTDLVFTSEESDGKEADRHLADAENGYKKAIEAAGKVRQAMSARDEALTALPYYSHWVAARPGDSDEVVGKLEALWDEVHKLDQKLREPRPEAVDELVPLGQAVAKGLKEVRDRHQKECDDYAARDVVGARQDNYHEIDALLLVPFIAAEKRQVLLSRLGEISSRLQKESRDAVGMSESELAEAWRNEAIRQGRLALAALGRPWIDSASADYQRYDLLVSNVRAAARDERWWATLTVAGDQAADHRNRLLGEVSRLAAAPADKVESAVEVGARLGRAATLARHLDGAAVRRLAGDPVRDHRRWLWHELLAWQARRSYLDYWAGEPDDPALHYRRIVQLYLGDATKLALGDDTQMKPAQKDARLVPLKEVGQLLEGEDAVVLEWRDPVGGEFKKGNPTLDLTDDDRPRRDYRVFVPDSVGEGAAVVWVAERGEGLSAPPGKDESVRRPLRVSARQKEKIDYMLEPSLDKPLERTRHVVKGIFRGRELGVTTLVSLHLVPHTVWAQPEMPAERRLVAQADEAVLARYGQGTGGIVIVLDCSNSMNAEQPNGRTRFQEAVSALDQVLAGIPEGTQVSLWVYGQQERGKDGFDDAEKIIKRFFGPEKWEDPKRSKQLSNLMARVSGLQPSGWTPLVRAMVEARRDLESVTGFKTLVVLTDGRDTRFERGSQTTDDGKTIQVPGDPDYNPNGTTKIEQFLTDQFKDSDIAIRVVGFQLAREDREGLLTKIKKPIESLPKKGEFYDVTDTRDLIAKLKQSLKQNLVYFVEDAVTSQRVGTDEEKTEGRLVTRKGENTAEGITLLDDKEYRVRVVASRPETQLVRIGRGELLRVVLVPDERQGYRFERNLFGRTARRPDLPPPEEVNGWLAGLWQNERNPYGQLQVMLSLEKIEPLSAAGALEQIRPEMVWFQVTPNRPGAAPARGVRFYPLPRYSAPVWGLDTNDWGAGVAPKVEMWWANPRARLASINLVRGTDFMASPAELEYKEIPVRGALEEPGSLVIESLRPAREKVLARADARDKEEVPCLVVRIRYPPGKPFYVQLPPSLPTHGFEHRFYPGASKYVGVFWKVSEEQIKQLKELTVVSLSRTLEDARKEGRYKEFKLDVPNARTRPQPQ